MSLSCAKFNPLMDGEKIVVLQSRQLQQGGEATGGKDALGMDIWRRRGIFNRGDV